METATSAAGGRGEESEPSAAVVLVVDGDLVVRDTAFFAGVFAEGDEELVVVFDESGGREGERSFVVSKQALRFCNLSTDGNPLHFGSMFINTLSTSKVRRSFYLL